MSWFIFIVPLIVQSELDLGHRQGCSGRGEALLVDSGDFVGPAWTPDPGVDLKGLDNGASPVGITQPANLPPTSRVTDLCGGNPEPRTITTESAETVDLESVIAACPVSGADAPVGPDAAGPAVSKAFGLPSSPRLHLHEDPD